MKKRAEISANESISDSFEGLPTLSELATLTLRHWFFVLMVTAIFSGAFYIKSRFFATIRYEAKAIIMPKMSRSGSSMEMLLGQLGNLGATSGFLSGVNANTELQQFYRLLTTRQMAESAVEQEKSLKEIGDPIKFKDEESLKNNVISTTQNSLAVKIDSPVLELRFVANSPDLALVGVEAYLKALQFYLTNNIITQSKGAEVFIQERLADLNKSLDQVEVRLSNIRTGKISPATLGRSVQSEVKRTETEFTRLNQLLDLLTKQYELAKIESKRNDIMFLIIDHPIKPISPVGVPIGKFLFLGAFFGFILSMFFLVLRERGSLSKLFGV
ncbi:MAG: hypothetical protein JWQ35_2249 [Bacteriovoracaceae bacterium]|nr:hypothetical protein [Bacteriovoracaceae bacterium]